MQSLLADSYVVLAVSCRESSRASRIWTPLLLYFILAHYLSFQSSLFPTPFWIWNTVCFCVKLGGLIGLCACRIVYLVLSLSGWRGGSCALFSKPPCILILLMWEELFRVVEAGTLIETNGLAPVRSVFCCGSLYPRAEDIILKFLLFKKMRIRWELIPVLMFWS